VEDTPKKEKNVIDIINNTRGIIDDISPSNIKNFSEDELSKKALHLSVMKSTISQSQSDLEYNLKLTKRRRKNQRDDYYTELKKTKKYTQEDCKIMANKKIRNVKEKELRLETLLNNVKRLRRDASSVISTIRDRIQTLRKAERKQNIRLN